MLDWSYTYTSIHLYAHARAHRVHCSLDYFHDTSSHMAATSSRANFGLRPDEVQSPSAQYSAASLGAALPPKDGRAQRFGIYKGVELRKSWSNNNFSFATLNTTVVEYLPLPPRSHQLSSASGHTTPHAHARTRMHKKPLHRRVQPLRWIYAHLRRRATIEVFFSLSPPHPPTPTPPPPPSHTEHKSPKDMSGFFDLDFLSRVEATREHQETSRQTLSMAQIVLQIVLQIEIANRHKKIERNVAPHRISDEEVLRSHA